MYTVFIVSPDIQKLGLHPGPSVQQLVIQASGLGSLSGQSLLSSFHMAQSHQEAGSDCASTVVGGFWGCTCSAHCRKWRTCSTQLPVAASFHGRHSLKASKGSTQAWQSWWITGWLEVHRAMLILRWWQSRSQGLVATHYPYWSISQL